MQALDTAATGMQAIESRVEILASNIANMGTPGFKKSRAVFQDMLYRTVRAPGAQTSEANLPTGLQIGTGVKIASTSRVMSQGSVEKTDQALNVAIRGEGFFRIELPNGQSAYTRDGSFELDAQGNLVTADGYSVAPGITVPANAIKIAIAQDGTVEATLPGSNLPTGIGQISLANFVNKAGLEAIGNNLYLATSASGSEQISFPGAQNYGSLLQGHIEQSNVSSVGEIVRLVSAQRAYEMCARLITASDEMLASTASILR